MNEDLVTQHFQAGAYHPSCQELPRRVEKYENKLSELELKYRNRLSHLCWSYQGEGIDHGRGPCAVCKTCLKHTVLSTVGAVRGLAPMMVQTS